MLAPSLFFTLNAFTPLSLSLYVPYTVSAFVPFMYTESSSLTSFPST